MGAEGEFQVMDIGPCPELEPGSGRVVTGEFRHSHGAVFDLWIDGESTPIGVTELHPVWSADRNDWISVSRMRVGERVLIRGAMSTVRKFEPRRTEPVFNLEVNTDHCYRVGKLGVLVHNASAGCDNPPGKGDISCDRAKLGKNIGGVPQDYQAHHLIACAVAKQFATTPSGVVKKAYDLGYDLNAATNGLLLPSDVTISKQTGKPLHKGGPLGDYTRCVARLLNALQDDYDAKRVSDCDLCDRLHGISKLLEAALLNHQIWLQNADPNIMPGQVQMCP